MSFSPGVIILASVKSGRALFLIFDRYEVTVIVAAVLLGVFLTSLRMPRIGELLTGVFMLVLPVIIPILGNIYDQAAKVKEEQEGMSHH
jgi:hypothetical protein